jgi:hypothetical protein
MCGDNLTSDELIRYLHKTLDQPEFVKWNTTSLEYVISWSIGYRGKVIRDLSLQLYDQFLSWYDEYRRDHYIIPAYDFAGNLDDLLTIRELLAKVDQKQFTGNEKHDLQIAIDFMNRIDS